MVAPDERSVDAEAIAAVDHAITSRRSVRAFLPDPVDERVLRDILRVASRAPSGTNMQPWKVYVTTGEAKERLSQAILSSGIRAEKAEWDEYKYYPDKFFEPYLQRRRTVGWARSEEHTSELQSRENLVCRLLLEKKKDTPSDCTP